MTYINASVIIPTGNRSLRLLETLKSINNQSHVPREVVIIFYDKESNYNAFQNEKFNFQLILKKADEIGAAKQRNQGVAMSTQPFIFFMDDDIDLEPGCIEKIWNAINADAELGGVNAIITNQQYHPPGRISNWLLNFINGNQETSYAGRCLGPVYNLLPEDREDLPEVVPVEWINTTCALYKKKALPDPPFPDFFKGYSMFEDVTVSSLVGKKWKLANVRTARIYHDSQPGKHKKSNFVLSRMETVNRFLVMTHILKRRGPKYNFQFLLVEAYKFLSYFSSPKKWILIPAVLAGKINGLFIILFKSKTLVNAQT